MSFLTGVTPVILTLNEECNIGRNLQNLSWATRIVVVDSGSTDRTIDICRADPRVDLFTRAFDTHAGQYTYAVEETEIDTPWILALDADYMLTPEARSEIDALPDDQNLDAYWCPFKYAVLGRVLRSGVYPPVRALFRREAAHYIVDGHAHRLIVKGASAKLKAAFIHDDRKSLNDWLRAQQRYAQLEAVKLAVGGAGFKVTLRTRTPFAPFVMGLYCLIVRGGLFEGPPGWFYALQRTLAEALIGLALLDLRLRRGPSSASETW